MLTLLVSGFFAVSSKPALASTTDGTIDPNNEGYKYAWGENIGWINFGTSNGNVHVTDSALSGYALSETVGWINLDGVVNDGEGNLSGYAWGENVGYIKFNPTNGGVTINSSGEFSGSALSENVGWIIFGGDYKVKTDWRPASIRTTSSINIVGKSADTAITTIIFPQGAPGATVSAPYNDVDTSSDPQVLSATVSEPVVRLKNTAGVTYNVTLEITTWTNGIAASEDYELVATTTTNIEAVAKALSANGDAASVDTAVSMAAGTYKALYLEMILSGVANKTGNSTLTILGELP